MKMDLACYPISVVKVYLSLLESEGERQMAEKDIEKQVEEADELAPGVDETTSVPDEDDRESEEDFEEEDEEEDEDDDYLEEDDE